MATAGGPLSVRALLPAQIQNKGQDLRMEKEKRTCLMEIVYSFETGGSETLAANLAAYFHTRGVPVAVCSTHSGEGPISRRLSAAGIACHAMAGDKYSRVRRLLDLYRLFRREAVDVLHIQHISLLPLCYWPARLAGVRRIVTTEHNEIFIRESGKLRRRARRYCSRINAVTAIHQELLDYLKDELQLPASKLHLIPNGVDTRRFAPGERDPALRRSLGIPDDAVVAACIGRLHEHKGHRDLLTAAKRVREGCDQFRLLIVGDGPLRQSLEATVRMEGLDETVLFLGERRDIDVVLKSLDIVVLSSETEGVPIVLLEAMSAGVPCIATAVGGVPELIGRTDGRLVPPREPGAMAEAIIELCRSPAKRRTTAKNARRKVLEQFDTEQMFAAYAHVLLGGPAQARVCRMHQAPFPGPGSKRTDDPVTETIETRR